MLSEKEGEGFGEYFSTMGPGPGLCPTQVKACSCAAGCGVGVLVWSGKMVQRRI